MSELSNKQMNFADEYLITGNATESAIKAGYSKKTARQQGARLLTYANVKEYLGVRMEELQDEKILKQKEILILLSEIGRGDAKEYQPVVTKTAEYIPNENYDPKLKNGNKYVMVYNETFNVVEIPTKNSDRNKALEQLGKYYSMWTDRKEVDLTEQVVFVGEAELED